jgi:hypothetical protein
MTQEKMKVVLNLQSITVEIEADPKNKEEILAKAKLAALDQLAIKFPALTYSTASMDALTMSTAHIGTVVNATLRGGKVETGVISGKNQKTVDVALKGGRILQGAPENFTLKQVDDLDGIVWGRRMGSTTWSEGDTGFIKTPNGKVPIVMGKSRGKKSKAFILNGEGRHYPLEESQLTLISID